MSDSNLNNIIIRQLSIIKNEPFRYIGRACNLAWLGFGKDVISKDYKGEERKTAQYALHIQCPFRISRGGMKVLASGDMYEPNSTTEWTEDFDWDIAGANLYDEKASLLTEKLSHNNITAVNIESNEMGDVKIYLSDGYVIEIFTNNSSETEEWRFFETGIEKEHFVITGKGIEYEDEEILK